MTLHGKQILDSSVILDKLKGTGLVTFTSATMSFDNGSVLTTEDSNINNGTDVVNKNYVDSFVPSVSNGISIDGSDNIVLGGTLSTTTTINADSNDFELTNADNVLFNADVFDVDGNGFISLDAGTGSVQMIADNDITISASNSVNIATNQDLDLTFATGSVTSTSLIGLVYSADYSSTFVNESLITKRYVDNQISLITSSDIDEVVAGSGLSGGGTQGIITLDVNTSNGLSIDGSDNIVLGGTLSTTTTINANSNDFELTNAGNVLFNADVFDVEGNGFISLDAGTGSVQMIADNDITISASNSVNIATNQDLDLTFATGSVTSTSLEGLLYAVDYSSTFVNESLITKRYVDNQISSITNSDIDEVVAGTGLTGGGTQGIVTLDVNTSNGLSIDGSDNIVLGGTLSTTTTINANSNDFELTNAGNVLFNVDIFDVEGNGFISLDAGTGSVQVLADNDITISASNSVNIATNQDLDLTFATGSVTSTGGEGLVYSADYSSTFINESLITKRYVDDLVNAIPDGDITGITAGDGLIGGGTAGSVTLNVVGGTGITVNTNDVEVSFTDVANGLAGDGLVANGTELEIDSSAAGDGLSISSGVFDVNVANGLQIVSDNVEVDPSIAGNGLTFSAGVLSIDESEFKANPVYQTGTSSNQVSNSNNFQTSIILSSTPSQFSRINVFVNGQQQRVSFGDTSGDCYFGTVGTASSVSNISSGDELIWNGLNAGFVISNSDQIEIIYEA